MSFSKFSKAVILGSALLGSVFALSINPDGAKIDVVAFKTNAKTPVKVTFKKATFHFNKTDGSAADILKGTHVIIDLQTIDASKNPVRDKNIKTRFFAHLANSNSAEATVTDVKGDDKSGSITADVTFNDKKEKVTFKYEVKDGKLVATGETDLTKNFGAKDAFETFRNDKVILGLHSKKTFSEINIGFEVPVK
ncbi:MAG: YceI family protein [Helicobacter sp.]|nr:YceI family protein [Helicobacter sp.]